MAEFLSTPGSCNPNSVELLSVKSKETTNREVNYFGKKRKSLFPPHIMPFMALTVVNPNWNLFADPSNRISAGGLALRNYRFTTLQQVLGLLDEG